MESPQHYSNVLSDELEAILEAGEKRPLDKDEIKLLREKLQSCSIKDSIVNLLCLNTNLYPILAIQRALYWISSERQCHLEMMGEQNVLITTSLEENEVIDISNIQKKLLQSINDFVIRLDIEEKTNSIRERIVHTALCETLGTQQ